ncbi:MAG: biopolymer transporter ExbD [Myxococcales bacterium]|nr:biopolymer transporter ExbD [Myxococcales bacterium]MCB9751989.1 biopolymer transporter ExbD [Myxococcales bacterium]
MTTRKKSEGDSAEVEANLVPIMNIMFLLIPALLLAMEFASMAAIDVTPPKFTTAPANNVDKPTEKDLSLTVEIREDGFLVRAREAGAKVHDDGKPSVIPNRGGVGAEHLDYPALASQLRDLKAAYPSTFTITVTAEQDIEMDALVRTLDTVRGDGCSLRKMQQGEEPGEACMFWNTIISSGAA